MQSNFLLQVLNGAAVTPEGLWLVLLAIYLCKEAKRRQLHRFDWFSLPPSMDLILAVFITDFGMCVRSLVVWIWRETGDGDFNNWETGCLIFGATLIVMGSLCKVRAMTRPDHGDRPWLICMASTCVAIGALLFFR